MDGMGLGLNSGAGTSTSFPPRVYEDPRFDDKHCTACAAYVIASYNMKAVDCVPAPAPAAVLSLDSKLAHVCDALERVVSTGVKATTMRLAQKPQSVLFTPAYTHGRSLLCIASALDPSGRSAGRLSRDVTAVEWLNRVIMGDKRKASVMFKTVRVMTPLSSRVPVPYVWCLPPDGSTKDDVIVGVLVRATFTSDGGFKIVTNGRAEGLVCVAYISEAGNLVIVAITVAAAAVSNAGAAIPVIDLAMSHAVCKYLDDEAARLSCAALDRRRPGTVNATASSNVRLVRCGSGGFPIWGADVATIDTDGTERHMSSIERLVQNVRLAGCLLTVVRHGEGWRSPSPSLPVSSSSRWLARVPETPPARQPLPVHAELCVAVAFLRQYVSVPVPARPLGGTTLRTEPNANDALLSAIVETRAYMNMAPEEKGGLEAAFPAIYGWTPVSAHILGTAIDPGHEEAPTVACATGTGLDMTAIRHARIRFFEGATA